MSKAQEIFDAVESHALASGLFDSVNTSEPKSAPTAPGLTCSIWIAQIGPAPAGSGLASTTSRLELNVRLYTGMLAEPSGQIDPLMTSACITMLEKYSGDFQLSNVTAASIRNVDLLGTYGTALTAVAGYLNVDNLLYRVMTITLPIIVNDLWTQTA